MSLDQFFPYLADEIQLSSSFDRSTNLEADLSDKKKLEKIYISEKFETTLLEILDSVLNEESNQRVRVLSGSPGLGKSTFAVLLLTLLSKEQKNTIRDLVHSAETDKAEELASLVENFLSSKKHKKLLPIILNGYEGDIEKVFLNRLESVFAATNLQKEWKDLLAKTTDHSKTILDWKRNYPKVYEQYLKYIESHGIEQKPFEIGLKRGLVSNRETFAGIHDQITGGAGATARDSDVIKIFRKATQEIRKHGYGGFFVVYDEFGKYLEKGIHNPSSLNVQFLQDFAEFCDRSEKNQCHLILITHMSVSQYASQLPINIQHEWAKIEGRFQENSFYDRSVNYFRLIERVFSKRITDDKRTKLYKRARKYYDLFFKKVNRKDGLEGFLDAVPQDLIESCFPLHPLSLALLPFLSQRVSQNERTLYTFLTRNENYTLKTFLEQSVSDDDALPLLLPSELYKYFSNAIKKDSGPGGSFRIGLIIDEAINTIHHDDDIGREIITIIGLAEIVKMPRLAPTSSSFLEKMLLGIFDLKKVRAKVEELSDRKIIFYNRFRDRFELRQGSSVDLKEELEKERQLKLTSKDLVNIIKKYHNTNYIIPKRYNFKHKICRFFEVHLLSVEELRANKFVKEANYEAADGIVYYVLPFDQDELSEARRIIKETTTKLVTFIVPNTFIECKKDIEELNAINSLYSNKELLATGPLVKKELDFHRTTILSAIKKVLEPVLGHFDIDVSIFYGSNSSRSRTFTSLQRDLGNLLEEEYSESIEINSELINKHKVSSAITLARRTFIQHLIDYPDKKNFDIQGNGPEKAIHDTIKTVAKFDWNQDLGKIELKRGSKLAKLQKTYESLISKKSEGITFDRIVEKLTKPPYGLRKSVIPCYLALLDKASRYEINHYFEGTYISSPDGDHYDLIFRHPKLSKIQMTKITDKHSEYLSIIYRAFGGKGKCETINDAISSLYGWRKSIPDYVKNSDEIKTSSKKMLIAIDSAQEPDKLLFASIPEALELKSDSFQYLKNLQQLKKDLSKSIEEVNSTYPNLLMKIRDHLEETVISLNEGLPRKLRIDPKNSLAESYQKVFSSLEENVKKHKFSKMTTQFIERFSTFDTSSHKQYFIETMGDVVTGRTPRSWEAKTINLFVFSLHKIKEEIFNVMSASSSSEEGHSVVAITNLNRENSRYIDLGAKQILKSKHQKVKAEILEKFDKDWSPSDIKILLVDLLSTLDLD